jgi:FTR1 family protein
MEEKESKGFAAKSRKYAMFFLPFITVLREGLEAVVFVGGVSLTEPATAFPIPVIVGIICGLLIGYFIYRYASSCYCLMVGEVHSSRLNTSLYFQVVCFT